MGFYYALVRNISLFKEKFTQSDWERGDDEGGRFRTGISRKPPGLDGLGWQQVFICL